MGTFKSVAIPSSKKATRCGKSSEFVHKKLALYPELSAIDNLMFFGRMAGLSGKSARDVANRHLEAVGLQDRAKDKVDHFSGGMKRRVNIAIALMSNPRLLFLDEPLLELTRSRATTFRNG